MKILFYQLLNNLLPDEEIVVVDGNSTDGSKEYLQQLFENGKIHQFISEPDKNQAHGWNKAFLMARGTVIKKIIDDDVHSFKAISICKDFMLNNPRVDICISNCLTTGLLSPKDIQKASRLTYYNQWKDGAVKSFTFSDVYMLIRKSSISFLGLFDTQFSMMDWEYSLRCSYLKANIVYYTGYNSLAVGTPGNVTSVTSTEQLKIEAAIGKAKYEYQGDRADISVYSELKIAIGKAINYKKSIVKFPGNEFKIPLEQELNDIYNSLYKELESYNHQEKFTFIN